jgi:hypothetical protein
MARPFVRGFAQRLKRWIPTEAQTFCQSLVPTKGQSSCQVTEPMTKTTNLDRRTDHFTRTTNGQTSCGTSGEMTKPTTTTMDPDKGTDLLSESRQKDRPFLPRSLLKNRARQRIRSPWWLDERLRRGFSGGIPCGRRALFQKASLRRSRRSRPSPLLRLALWKNASPRYQPGFFNRLLALPPPS